ncbi:photosynthetic reaction center cytochrome PufC [Aestuariivirga sp.]|uniref:photosynthetic reaction center cytochrome PufC n=1 Tax=Aestuariivirga sp. TaxID=2650926 RepID=UPI0035B26785
MKLSATTLTASLLVSVIAILLAIPMMLQWERPPMDTTQEGFRGLGMEQVTNPRLAERLKAANLLPTPDDPVPNDGVLVKDDKETYKNVQVLGDLDTAQFVRLMAAISVWVAPQEGDNASCAYCHNTDNMASDEKYTKVVARRMLQMTRAINTQYKPHVAETGVTCYTCHRGQPVPANIWSTNPGMKQAGGFAASRDGQNLAHQPIPAYASLPYDPFTPLLSKPGETIRVVATTALPGGTGADVKKTETTYALMMHMSTALGVNCTFCHNTRQFANWQQSRPQRVTAWHGIELVRDVNANYLGSLTDVFPANRKGPMGDVMKVDCATCHNGVNKPLYGFSMAKSYPELSVPNP